MSVWRPTPETELLSPACRRGRRSDRTQSSTSAWSSTSRAPRAGSPSGLTSRITSIDGAVQMNPAYAAAAAQRPAPWSTSTTDAPSFDALLAAVKPAIPAPSTSRSIGGCLFGHVITPELFVTLTRT